MAKIQYGDKTNKYEITNEEQQVSAENMNEVKSSVNDLYDEVGAGTVSDNKLIYSINTVGDFADFIDAIIDAADDKRYSVEIRPGTYITKPVTMKPYIYVSGDSKGAVSFTPVNDYDTVFTMSTGSTLANVIIQKATTGKAVLFNSPGFCSVDNVTIIDCLDGVELDNASASMDAVDITGASTSLMNSVLGIKAGNCTITKMSIADNGSFNYGIVGSGSDSIVTLNQNISFSANLGYGIHLTDGVKANCLGNNFTNGTTALYVTGNGTTCFIKASVSVNAQQYGMHIPGDGTNPLVISEGVVVSGSGLFDAFIENSGATLSGDISLDLSRSMLPEGININLSVKNSFAGDEGTDILGELHVGHPIIPRESCFGEGDSHSFYKAYTFDGTSSYTDVTTELKSNTGSTITLPTAVNSALYISSPLSKDGDYIKIPGIKLIVTENLDGLSDITVTGTTSPTTAAGNYNQYGSFNGRTAYARTDDAYWLFFTQGFWVLNDEVPIGHVNYYDCRYFLSSLEGTYQPLAPNTGSPTVDLNTDDSSNPYVLEYYNGEIDSWVSVNYIMKGSSSPYTPYAKSIFELQGQFQVWFNLLLDNELIWTPSDNPGLGIDLFWIRLRLTSGVTTGVSIEQIKAHSNRAEIEDDGFMHFYGSGRYFKALPWDAGLFQAANSSPGNQDLFISDNLNRGYIENAFANNATDRVGLNRYLPPELDTSTPIRLLWSTTSNSSSGGNINWYVRWGWTSDGDSVYTSTAGAPGTGPNEQELNLIDTAPDNVTQKTYSADLDVSNIIATRPGGFGDVLWVCVERQGGSTEDTHGGTVSLINAEPLYASLALGGHI